MNLVPTRWYTMLVMPSFVGLALIAVGVWIVWRATRRRDQGRMPRRGAGVAAAGATLLYMASTPLVATWLAWTLERQTPFVPMAQLPTADAIVLLGGGQAAHANDQGALHWYFLSAGDRFERAIDAFRAGKAPLFAVGGGVLQMPGEPLASEFLRQRAIARGVPEGAVLACGRVHYTTDEASELVKRLRERGVRSILLCTSAYHMPRARLVYESLGMQVTPLPADFCTQGSAERLTPLLLVPRGLALSQTETCLKEWLGITAAWLTGSG